MKTNKWRKWQIGTATALLLGVLFQEIKGTEAFAKAHEEALAAKPQTIDAVGNRDLAMGGGFDDNGGGRRGPRGRGGFDDNGSLSGSINGNGGTSGNGTLGTSSNGGTSVNRGSTQMGGGTTQPTVRSQTRTGRS